MVYTDFYFSPLGWLKLESSSSFLQQITFLTDFHTDQHFNTNKLLKDSINQLDNYFKGKIKEFNIHYSLTGTDFQKKIWKILLQIPYGTTVSYKFIAEKAGTCGFQAVGQACGQNRLPFIIPCHRVIGSDKSLKGFSAGISNKDWIINFELGNLK